MAKVRQNRSLTDAARLSARVRGKREVLGMVLWQAGRLVAVGIVLAAGWCGRERNGCPKASSLECYAGPVFLLSASAVILIAGLAAAYLLALWAASVDPMQALRSE